MSSDSGWELGLADADNAGVYFVTMEDLDTLGVAARDAGLQVRRIDLGGADKHQLLLRISTALDFPNTFGRNWDALSDSLRDLSWLPKAGFALLFENGGALHQAEGEDFDSLLEILEESAQDWAEREVPFWSFIALPESVFDEIDQQASE
ncbi:barstar family protein [Lysobacter sp. A6]|uniref:Barstar family protein n=1 Tax=Noviluteimonas lactosilytica TaxID=2888523 RepID=A0ABS8JE13_9GAMM|nr:barstar family protein [Lysobacter lactosilyticus]MCC8361837.1 barstar family protein [Lysobacter lactosilyticus]